MVAPATRAALNTRALNAVSWLSRCIEELETEMKNQNVEMFPPLIRRGEIGDGKTPMILTRDQMRKLVLKNCKFPEDLEDRIDKVIRSKFLIDRKISLSQYYKHDKRNELQEIKGGLNARDEITI